jgi:hypothetical protein
VRVLCCQFRMVELLSGRLSNIAVDAGVRGSLFCAIGLYDLIRNFLLAAENRCRCSVLAINDRKLPTLYRRHDDRSELRPIEVFGDLIERKGFEPKILSIDRHAVQIEPGLRSLSPENGNISNIRRRLWAVSLWRCSNLETGDRPPIRKSPPLAAIYAIAETKSPAVGLPGWRPSADRTRLQANSLLTGNFTGNFAFLGLWEAIS